MVDGAENVQANTDTTAGTVSVAVCEYGDRHGFGLSAAAIRHARSAGNAVLVAIRRPEGDCGFPILHQDGPWWRRRLLDPVALDAALARYNPGLIHIHGVWTGALRHVARLQRRGIAVVISPHGMFDASLLAHGRLKKGLVNLWFHRTALRRADGIHVLTEFEAEQVRSYLGGDHPGIRVIPNGIDLPAEEALSPQPHAPRTVLYCGRLHANKRIDWLLDAWRDADVHARMQMVIAGDGEGPYAAEVRARAASLPGVRLLGYVGGEAKDAAFRASDFGILAGRCEAQSIAVLEALAYGKPCILTPGCRYPAMRTLGWEGDSVAELAAALRAAADLPDARYAELSVACRRQAVVEHDWTRIGQRMRAWYAELVTARDVGASKPAGASPASVR